MRSERAIGPEQCLALPAAEVATRCPNMGGRLVTVGSVRYALVERYEPRRATLWCDEGEGHWRCRRVVVLDHELRTTRRRNPQAYVTADELLRTVDRGAPRCASATSWARCSPAPSGGAPASSSRRTAARCSRRA